MAPFVRGKRGTRGNSQFASRGTSYGRGANRGRGRGSSATKTGDRSTFYATRVEEQVDDGANPSLEDPAISDEESVSDVLDDSDSDVDLENEQRHTNSYNTLLLSFNAKTQDGPSQRKKRKFDKENLKETSLFESHEKQLDFQNDPRTIDGDVVDGKGVEDQPDPEEANTPDEIEEEVEEDIEDVAIEDPFSRHIADPEESHLAKQIRHIKSAKLKTVKITTSSELTCSFTASEGLEIDQNMYKSLSQTTPALQLKQRLQKPAENILSGLGSVHRVLTGPIFDYKDLLYVERTIHNADTLRKLSCLHVLNHLYKTRDRVIKNNARLAKDSNEVDIEFRDQGFTRPKVLIILPTRQNCAKWVETIVSLCEPEQQENRKRLQDSYTSTEDNLSEEKPIDFQELFGGNDDDMFRVGLKFTRKTIKYFSQFYNSDIIFASPLGLRMAIGTENDKKHDHDYLSSIEIVIADQADALSMQNWEHIEFIFEHLNLQPKEAHGCDFSRVRNWYLDGNARYLRQTLIFAAFNFPALNRLYLHEMLNVAGRIKLAKPHEGAILKLGISVKQTFSRFDYVNPLSEPDDRHAYFSTAIVPILTKHSTQGTTGKQGILVYLPSYADFVRVRNHLATSSAAQNISFGSISEYTSVSDVARARSHFFTGRHSVLLYTERAHHFRRYHLRGVKRIFMYGLPENPIFYKDVVGGFLGSSIREGKPSTGEAGVRSLFSKLDVLKLERIVGSSRMSSMIREKGGDTFDFI